MSEFADQPVGGLRAMCFLKMFYDPISELLRYRRVPHGLRRPLLLRVQHRISSWNLENLWILAAVLLITDSSGFVRALSLRLQSNRVDAGDVGSRRRQVGVPGHRHLLRRPRLLDLSRWLLASVHGYSLHDVVGQRIILIKVEKLYK